MITVKHMAIATYLIHKDGLTWIKSFSAAYKLRAFYNLADEMGMHYEKNGLYFNRVKAVERNLNSFCL